MRCQILVVFISLYCCTSIAQQIAKYLPCKITTDQVIYKIEYDDQNRIIEIEEFSPSSVNFTSSITRSYIYLNDGFSEKRLSSYEQKDSIKKHDPNCISVYKKHLESDTLVVYGITTTLLDSINNIEKNSIEVLSIAPKGKIKKKEIKHSEDDLKTTLLDYDDQQRLISINNKIIKNKITYKYSILFKYDIDILRKGIFQDVNFNPTTKAAQISNLSLLIVDQVPNKVSDKTGSEIFNIEYTYNEKGYPINFITKNTDNILVTNIEYIEVKN